MLQSKGYREKKYIAKNHYDTRIVLFLIFQTFTQIFRHYNWFASGVLEWVKLWQASRSPRLAQFQQLQRLNEKCCKLSPMTNNTGSLANEVRCPKPLTTPLRSSQTITWEVDQQSSATLVTEHMGTSTHTFDGPGAKVGNVYMKGLLELFTLICIINYCGITFELLPSHQ